MAAHRRTRVIGIAVTAVAVAVIATAFALGSGLAALGGVVGAHIAGGGQLLVGEGHVEPRLNRGRK